MTRIHETRASIHYGKNIQLISRLFWVVVIPLKSSCQPSNGIRGSYSYEELGWKTGDRSCVAYKHSILCQNRGNSRDALTFCFFFAKKLPRDRSFSKNNRGQSIFLNNLSPCLPVVDAMDCRVRFIVKIVL